MQSKKIYLFILLFGLGICALLIIIMLIVSVSTPSQEMPQVLPSPTPLPKVVLPKKANPPSLKIIPTLSQEQGGEIDMNSEIVQKSIREINKLTPYLPYKKDVTLSTGLLVSILIPEKSLQSNPWTLTVQIFGIDYNTRSLDKNYSVLKTSFREAASIVFTWMINNNVNPNDILIQWGDRAFIQEGAENFLKN